MKTRVTQTDIARVAGVHNTTVSLALRNSPAIPEPTRKRIQEVAEQLGYHPDPALQALVAYRTGTMPRRTRDTLAFLTHWSTRWGWRALPSCDKAYAGAERRAAECGYQVEHFWLGEPGMTPRRMSSMLFHRGITGVIVAAHSQEIDDLADIDWSRLSAVKIGCFPHSPALHRVMSDEGGAVRLAMRHAAAAGFGRIGLVIPRWCDDLVDQAWSTGFLIEQSRFSTASRVAPLLLGGSREEWLSGGESYEQNDEMAAFEQWFLSRRPEVILGFGPAVLEWIQRAGLIVPDDVAYVSVGLEDPERTVAGVRPNGERVGEVAVEMLVAQLQQNAFGVPAVATTTLVDGVWLDAPSLPSNRPAAAWTGGNDAGACPEPDGAATV